MFDSDKILTAVTAEKAEVFTFGYFANDVASLRQSVQSKKQNFKTVYAMLNSVLEDKYEKRFSCPYGTFSLFYPTGRTEEIELY